MVESSTSSFIPLMTYLRPVNSSVFSYALLSVNQRCGPRPSLRGRPRIGRGPQRSVVTSFGRGPAIFTIRSFYWPLTSETTRISHPVLFPETLLTDRTSPGLSIHPPARKFEFPAEGKRFPELSPFLPPPTGGLARVARRGSRRAILGSLHNKNNNILLLQHHSKKHLTPKLIITLRQLEKYFPPTITPPPQHILPNIEG